MVTMKCVLMTLGTSVVPVKVAIANLSMTQKDAHVGSIKLITMTVLVSWPYGTYTYIANDPLLYKLSK